jgi:hypothetical protein
VAQLGVVGKLAQDVDEQCCIVQIIDEDQEKDGA